MTVWLAHQRAYKKYYARVAKGNLTKSEFNDWAQTAEQLRNDALKLHERGKLDFDRYLAELNYIE